MKTIGILFILAFLSVVDIHAQSDSLRLDLSSAERQFLSKNYQLLAANYEIGQAQAEIITAKLFDNPEISYENLFYNHETKKFLETSAASGQYSAQIAQLIKLAGKRKKSIQLAESGAKIATHEYAETLRNLRYQLRNTFYKAYYSQKSAEVFKREITASQQLLKIYQQQLTKGNVAQKDVIRIQSLIVNLQSSLRELLNDLEDDFRDLKLLCNIDVQTTLKLVLDEPVGPKIQELSYNSLIDSAKANRADYQIAKSILRYSEANLKLQKANAVPDVQISLSYDLKGNYPEKYTGLGISLPIPLFNRNQGEIKKAKIGIESSVNQLKMYEAILINEVHNTYQTTLRTEQQYQSIDPQFDNNFEQLMSGINKSFMERNLSLIEFLDFYNSYKENALLLNQLKYQRLSNREELNLVTGSTIFK